MTNSLCYFQNQVDEEVDPKIIAYDTEVNQHDAEADDGCLDHRSHTSLFVLTYFVFGQDATEIDLEVAGDDPEVTDDDPEAHSDVS